MANLIFKAEGFVDTEDPEYYKSVSAFIIEKDFSSLKFEFFSEGKPLYFHVTDPEERVRVQILGKYDSKETILYADDSKCGTGTCPGEISRGEWKISAFAFGGRSSSRLGKVSFEVKVFEGDVPENAESSSVSWLDKVEFKKGRIALREFEMEGNGKDGLRYLKGDFHTHTLLSDGSASPEELLEEGLNKKLDFFFTTEHGILNTSFPEKKGISVYPSFEVTTSGGHFNLHGLRFIPEKLLESGPLPEWSVIEKIMTDAGKSGALVSINHPMQHPWEWLYNDLPLFMIDALEIISDPYAEGAPEANDEAVRFLDVLWNEGFRITGIGGSDTHTAFSESQLGQPATKVYAKPGSLNSILEGIKNHNASVFVDLDCVFEYRIDGKPVSPGKVISRSDDLEIIFDPAEKIEEFILNVIENGITVDEIKTNQGRISVKRKWDENSDWIRCEIRDSRNKLRGYINPVYREFNSDNKGNSLNTEDSLNLSGSKPFYKDEVESSIKTWGDAVALME